MISLRYQAIRRVQYAQHALAGRFLSSVEAAPAASSAGNSAAAATSVRPPRRKRPTNIAINEQNINKAFDEVKKYSWARFDETIDAIVGLDVDPRKPNQSIKGVASLPHGVGKKIRVAVFAKDADIRTALDAGADLAGADDLIARVQSGDIPFDRAIATPEIMPMLSKIGRILGPRGLMPNPKIGTVTKDVAQAVKNAKAGSVQYRVEKQGIIQAGIGKVSFSREALLDNFRSFLISIVDAKPDTLKGKYIVNVYVKSTMGPAIPVEVASADPTNARFMLEADILLKK